VRPQRRKEKENAMRLSEQKRNAIIQTVNRWERIAAKLENKNARRCSLCIAVDVTSDWSSRCCADCPVCEVFGDTASDSGGLPCIGLLPHMNPFRPRVAAHVTATAAAMIAAVLGVKVPKARGK